MARIEMECRRCGWKTVVASIERMKEWDTEHDAECPALRRAEAFASEVAG
jgi:hypothetical protein